MNKIHAKKARMKLTQRRQAAKEGRKQNARFLDSAFLGRDRILANGDALPIVSALPGRLEVSLDSDG